MAKHERHSDTSEAPIHSAYKRNVKCFILCVILTTSTILVLSSSVMRPNVNWNNLHSILNSQENHVAASVPPPPPQDAAQPGTQVQLQEKLLVVVPYRNREQHRKQFLKEMTAYLRNKNMSYNIIFVEQFGRERFNRAKLVNVGVSEGLKQYLNMSISISKNNTFLGTPMQALLELQASSNVIYCIVIHDVDMLPETDKVPYNCKQSPLQLATAIQQFNYKLPYTTYMGGVTAIDLRHFLKINGMPNRYWGWGGEDDDFYQRVVDHGLKPNYLNPSLGIFKSLEHVHDRAQEFPGRSKEVLSAKGWEFADGFQQTIYSVLNVTTIDESIFILVDLIHDKS